MAKIWILDDEPNIGLSLRLILEREGHTIRVFPSIGDLRAGLFQDSPDLFLLDVRLPDGSGIEMLKQLGGKPAVMISGHGTIADAVEAIHAGAFDFLEKPLSRDRVLVAIKNALEAERLKTENKELRQRLVAEAPRMIGGSSAWKQVVDQATLAARTDARVLFLGESGTGKELLAAHVHENSAVKDGPFIKVNCAAIPAEILESEIFGHEKGAFTGAATQRKGKFELAHQGTLFLDEVGDLAQPAQAKLLRVLQEGEFHRLGSETPIRVTVRVVAATNKDLTVEVKEGRFREDLYYRLAVMPLRVPALREHSQDVAPLAHHFLGSFCSRNNLRPKSFAPETLALLTAYAWPGNVRELKNLVERMAILTAGEVMTAESAPLELRLRKADGPPNTLDQARHSAERETILRALEGASWNISAAARALGLERTSLHKRIRLLGIQR